MPLFKICFKDAEGNIYIRQVRAATPKEAVAKVTEGCVSATVQGVATFAHGQWSLIEGAPFEGSGSAQPPVPKKSDSSAAAITLGVIGSATIFIGTYLPLVSVEPWGWYNLHTNGADGFVFCVLAGIALTCSIYNMPRGVLGLGIITLLATSYEFSALLQVLETSGRQAAAAHGRQVASATMETVQFRSGWFVLLGGSIILIGSAAIALMARPSGEAAPNDSDVPPSSEAESNQEERNTDHSEYVSVSTTDKTEYGGAASGQRLDDYASVTPHPLYRVVTLGGVAPGFDTNSVCENLQEQFSISQDKAKRLISRQEKVIKKGVTQETAEKIRLHMFKIGVPCIVQPEDEYDSKQ